MVVLRGAKKGESGKSQDLQWILQITAANQQGRDLKAWPGLSIV
jgi:hypothetical protein